jgi:hypothetical protein
LLAQEEDWTSATEPGGSRRDGAWVTELTDLLDLSSWPVLAAALFGHLSAALGDHGAAA